MPQTTASESDNLAEQAVSVEQIAWAMHAVEEFTRVHTREASDYRRTMPAVQVENNDQNDPDQWLRGRSQDWWDLHVNALSQDSLERVLRAVMTRIQHETTSTTGAPQRKSRYIRLQSV